MLRTRALRLMLLQGVAHLIRLQHDTGEVTRIR